MVVVKIKTKQNNSHKNKKGGMAMKWKAFLKNNKHLLLLLILPVYFAYFFLAEKAVPSDG